MSISTTEAKLYRTFYDFFEQHNYGLLPDKKQFRKITAGGFLNVIFSVTEYAENDAWVEVHFGCHNQHIEQIAQQFLATNLLDFRNDTNTIIISIGNYNNVKYFRYKIQSDEDIQTAYESITSFFETVGFEFLETLTKVTEVERILNFSSRKPCKFVYNQTHRCFKGMIAAKFTENPKFFGLALMYDVYLNSIGQYEESVRFKKMIDYLHHYSAN